MDSIFLAFTSPRPVAFLAKAEYFDRPVTRWIFRNTGQIPLRSGSPTSAREAVAAASAVLANGGLVGIYPEGTRSPDGTVDLATSKGHLRTATDTIMQDIAVLSGQEYVDRKASPSEPAPPR